MRKRHRSSFSLWPEGARPRRIIPLTPAFGGLAIGIACAVAVYIVVIDFYRSVFTQEALETSVVHVPIYATATAPVTAAEPVGSITRTRSPRAVAKVTLPIIGSRAITQSRDTDGRGGGTPKGEPPQLH